MTVGAVRGRPGVFLVTGREPRQLQTRLRAERNPEVDNLDVLHGTRRLIGFKQEDVFGLKVGSHTCRRGTRCQLLRRNDLGTPRPARPVDYWLPANNLLPPSSYFQTASP